MKQVYRLRAQSVIKVLIDEKITQTSSSRIISWIYDDFSKFTCWGGGDNYSAGKNILRKMRKGNHDKPR